MPRFGISLAKPRCFEYISVRARSLSGGDMGKYVHGYTSREAERLADQAGAVSELIHGDTRYPQGARVLEAGCGVGAQTVTLAARSPGARFVSVDVSEESLAAARAAVAASGAANVEFLRADVRALPFDDASFDHVFVCFLLEHLGDPASALVAVRCVLAPGGTITLFEGDHGSCYWHPETPLSRLAWRCLVEAQARLGGDSLIGRRLYPLAVAAGFREVTVSPRMVYCDAGNPALVDAFVRKTISAMVEGSRPQALQLGLASAADFDAGVAELYALADNPEATFCYTFFKAVALR